MLQAFALFGFSLYKAYICPAISDCYKLLKINKNEDFFLK